MTVPNPMRKRTAFFLSFELYFLHDILETNFQVGQDNHGLKCERYIDLGHIQPAIGILYEFRSNPTVGKGN